MLKWANLGYYQTNRFHHNVSCHVWKKAVDLKVWRTSHTDRTLRNLSPQPPRCCRPTAQPCVESLAHYIWKHGVAMQHDWSHRQKLSKQSAKQLTIQRVGSRVCTSIGRALRASTAMTSDFPAMSDDYYPTSCSGKSPTQTVRPGSRCWVISIFGRWRYATRLQLLPFKTAVTLHGCE